jgi:hypothetical protein
MDRKKRNFDLVAMVPEEPPTTTLHFVVQTAM